MAGMKTLGLSRDGPVGLLELCKPPNNFVSVEMMAELADVLAGLDEDPSCRAVVLSAQGKHFCAGSDLSNRPTQPTRPPGQIYVEAARVVRFSKPIVAAIQGAAIGAGLGLALIADFRVGCAEARLSANFARQGYHHGFGLSFTLPRLAGPQKAAWLLYAGERIGGEEAFACGLLDRLVPQDQLIAAAVAMAMSVAVSGPLAITATRATLRAGFAEQFDQAVAHEMHVQEQLRGTEDFREGVRAMTERQTPEFKGR